VNSSTEQGDVVGTLDARNVVLSASAGYARPARRAVADLCATGQLGPDVCDAAALLTTELVMNAIEHGGGTAVLDAELLDGTLRVSVTDDDPVIPEPRRAPDPLDSERGRGLFLVAAMATRWGSRPLGTGKAVWFELGPV
jgi:anti-sigma regulatory factor (Ser/Thr protein kinase)